MATFKRSKSEKKTTDRGRSRLRAHTAAYSSEQYMNINVSGLRSRSQRPYPQTPVVETKHKLKSNKRKRANSVGKKNKNKQYEQKVYERNINSQFLSDQDTKITFTMQNVENTMVQLEQIQQTLTTDIQKQFENIMLKIKQQQLTLENDLNDLVNKKKGILASQLDELNKYKTNLKIITENFNKNNNKNVVLGFLNDSNNTKFNRKSVQPAVSGNILINFNDDFITNIISTLGSIQSGEVPISPPIIKVSNKTSNTIEVKCYEPRNSDTQTLEITKFEVEYCLLPAMYKSKWKKMKKTIFDIVQSDVKSDDDNKENEKVAKKIIINKHKNFKKNIVVINDLGFDCNYLIRCRCYNTCGYGPWSLPKMVSIYDINKDGHWEFKWEYYTDNMGVTNNNKTVTKTSNKNEWDSLAKGPCFPINFIESQMKIYWNVKINNCAQSDKGSLHFGIMSKKIKPEDVYDECIGFAEYESLGMEKYEQSPTFNNQSVVKIVVDFKLGIVEFYEGDKFCAMQKLNVLKQKISDLCFGIGSYRKKK
eukprot:331793_1